MARLEKWRSGAGASAGASGQTRELRLRHCDMTLMFGDSQIPLKRIAKISHSLATTDMSSDLLHPAPFSHARYGATRPKASRPDDNFGRAPFAARHGSAPREEVVDLLLGRNMMSSSILRVFLKGEMPEGLDLTLFNIVQ